MRVFILYILKILLVLWLFAIGLQYIADRGLMRNEVSTYREWNRIIRGQLNADLLVLGSSRAHVSYDPKIFQNELQLDTYNLSLNAAPYRLQKAKYDLYKNTNNTPQVIIQNVDLTHFLEAQYIPDEFQFIPYISNPILQKELSVIDESYSLYPIIPLLKYNKFNAYLLKGICSFFGKKYSIKPSYDGYYPREQNYQRDSINIERFKKLNSDISNVNLYMKGISESIAFYEQLRKDDIKVVLIWAPEYKERLQVISNLKPAVQDKLLEYAAHYDTVYFLDFSEDIISMNKDYFYDSFHLNKDGAEKFSKKVTTELKKILNK